MTDKTADAAEGPLKPQVIELSADDVTEVKAGHDEPPSHQADPPPVAPPKRKSGSWRWIAVALLLGAIGGGWLYRDVLSAYLPSGEMTALKDQIGALEANDKALQERLAAMIASVDQANADTGRLGQSVRDVADAFNATQQKIDGVDQRIAGAEKTLAAMKADVDKLRNAVSLGGAGSGSGADAAALAALGQRVDTLEKDIASLKQGAAGTGGPSQAAVLSQSLADLKAKIAAGTGYQAEFDRIARMVPAAPGLDVLGQHASLGLPTATGLATELRDLVPSLPAPEAAAPAAEKGYWDSFWDGLTSVITIRDIGETDWRALAGDAAGLAEAGDLTGAIARIDEAEGAKPSGLTQWRDRAASRLKLEKALEETSGAVLRQITALGGAQ